MTDLVVHPLEKSLVGSVPVPSDKSIGHRALLLASLCVGVSNIRAFSAGEDNLATANAMRALGAKVDTTGPGELRVTGTGLMGLRPSSSAIDCGSSATAMSLLLGVLSGQDFASTLAGALVTHGKADDARGRSAACARRGHRGRRAFHGGRRARGAARRRAAT